MKATKSWRHAAIVAAALSATACGGDSAVPPPPPPQLPPPPAAPPPTSAPALLTERGQIDAAFALLELVQVHARLSTSALDFPLPTASTMPTSGPCALGEGSFQISLVPTLPSPAPGSSRRLSVRLSNCLVDGLVGIRLDGKQLAEIAADEGSGPGDFSAGLVLDAMHGVGSLGLWSPIGDVTAVGGGSLQSVQVNGETIRTFMPTSGSRLTNNATTAVATFGGGTYEIASDRTISGGSFHYRDLRFSINGTPYVLDGTYRLGYAGGTMRLIGSGEVQITSDGVLVARLLVEADGWPRAEVFKPLTPF